MAETNTLASKLLKVQTQLKAPKNQYNNFGKYSYRNCEDILEAVKPLLAEQGLLLTITDDVEIKDNGRTYVKAIANITDGTSTYGVIAFAREPETKKGMDESQVTGASSSYARKYALNGLFLIDDTKDADSMNNASKGNTKAQSAKPKAKAQPKEPEAFDALAETLKIATNLTKQAINCGIKKEGIVSYITASFASNKKVADITVETFSSGDLEKLERDELNTYIKHITQNIQDKKLLDKQGA